MLNTRGHIIRVNGKIGGNWAFIGRKIENPVKDIRYVRIFN